MRRRTTQAVLKRLYAYVHSEDGAAASGPEDFIRNSPDSLPEGSEEWIKGSYDTFAACAAEKSKATASATAGLLISRQLFEKESSTYTYILACPLTREAVIIDPVDTQA
jgi:hypothetical protein